MDPHWLRNAKRHLGLTEIPGKEHAPKIVRWLRDLKAWWFDDETPWCGTYVAAVMRESRLSFPKHWYRAKAWLGWGVKLDRPAFGCVVVFERAGGGHVGFVVGRDIHGRLLVLGGNQGNKVSVAPFEMNRVLGYRWPLEAIMDPRVAPPVLAFTGAASGGEV